MIMLPIRTMRLASCSKKNVYWQVGPSQSAERLLSGGASGGRGVDFRGKVSHCSAE